MADKWLFIRARGGNAQMNRLKSLENKLEPGTVYRRAELEKWSKSVDRHLQVLVDKGALKKLRVGTYYCPKKSTFGTVPAETYELVKSFLKDDSFLLTSPNAYNMLGLGTTQLYSKYYVYNNKRHGVFELGNRKFEFKRRSGFPAEVTEEFLLVDMLNNLSKLAENEEQVKESAKEKAKELDGKLLRELSKSFGKVATKKFIQAALA